jgi:hypothetical protein
MIKIKSASFHRNGIGGEGFTAILFHDSEEKGDMIASLFDEPGYCAVYSVDMLAQGNIEFANGNSWRGDCYEEKLRPLLDEYQKKSDIGRAGPFSINSKIFENLSK